MALDLPLIGVNHVEAHLYAGFMRPDPLPPFPYLGAILSGGHSSIVLVEDIGTYKELGNTIDDALGESYDKVASLLGLPYPGGPVIEKLARGGDPKYFKLQARASEK